jgi:hypothetical protein
MYDYRCDACGHDEIDVLAPITAAERACTACRPGLMRRVILPGRAHAVIGDEIDVTIRHGLCDEVTGEPVRYRSREAIRKEAARRGLTNAVEHIGAKGHDTNRATTRWI